MTTLSDAEQAYRDAIQAHRDAVKDDLRNLSDESWERVQHASGNMQRAALNLINVRNVEHERVYGGKDK